jgi:hypothetical protein
MIRLYLSRCWASPYEPGWRVTLYLGNRLSQPPAYFRSSANFNDVLNGDGQYDDSLNRD